MKNKLNFIDLFAGAGGLSEGFIRAGFRRAGFPNPARREFQILKTDIHGWYKVLIVLIPKQN